MIKELELWRFVRERISAGSPVVLLVVGDSFGSSPGRAGFKMAVAQNALCGSIGGGVMEVRLVETARKALSGGGLLPVSRQVHRENSEEPSGMICSGEQTVVFKSLGPEDSHAVETILSLLEKRELVEIAVTRSTFLSRSAVDRTKPGAFESKPDGDFEYREVLGARDRLFIIGGGHCALALSRVMSDLGFRTSLFDDRSDLNTIEKNTFADEITLLDDYRSVAEFIPTGDDVFVVVMTIGYRFDDLVIRQLAGKEFRYFGVLGSKAKMAALLRGLRRDGFPEDWVSKVRTPIGVPINSRTPEEIAISIAAEVIAIRNSRY